MAEIARAQPVTVNLIHGSKAISTTMLGLSDSHLLIEKDSIHLNRILSLYFSETLPDSITVTRLNNLGILIYLKSERLKIKDNTPDFSSKASIGLGLGLDFGGYGIKFSLFPAKPIGIFAGLGSNTVELGYNVGVDWKFKPYKRTSGFLAVMYGYNAVIDQGSRSETFYGLSGEFGGRLRMGKGKNYLSLGLVIPITRDSDFKELKKTYGDDFDYSPLLVSIGFNFGL